MVAYLLRVVYHCVLCRVSSFLLLCAAWMLHLSRVHILRLDVNLIMRFIRLPATILLFLNPFGWRCYRVKKRERWLDSAGEVPINMQARACRETG